MPKTSRPKGSRRGASRDQCRCVMAVRSREPRSPRSFLAPIPDGAALYARDVRDPTTSRLAAFGTTIFARMSALAAETGAINLGQGFPDTDGPTEVLDAAVAAIRGGQNQYPPGLGIADLRHAVAEHQQRFWGLTVDPDTEVLITAGATEALAGSLLGILETGDEVIVFEPMFDSYQACIALAGATVVPVTLIPGVDGYTFDPEALRAAVSPRTRLILLNTPHNPTGKVFTRDEMLTIAEVALEHDLLVITDEVYEHLVCDDREHVPMATLPDMWERTLTISSGGKTFSTTGWKIGWVCGPQEIVRAAMRAKQFLTYVNGAPFQPAIATGLRLGDDYFTGLARRLQDARDSLATGLDRAGFTVYPSEATYFTTVDITPVRADGDGMALCEQLPHLIGVVAVPNEVFYVDPARGRNLVRFACCKRPEVINEAVERLGRLKEVLA